MAVKLLADILRYFGISSNTIGSYRLIERGEDTYIIALEKDKLLDKILTRLGKKHIRYIGIRIYSKKTLQPEISVIIGRFATTNYIVIDYRKLSRYIDLRFIRYEDRNIVDDVGDGKIKIIYSAVEEIKYPVGIAEKRRYGYKLTFLRSYSGYTYGKSIS